MSIENINLVIRTLDLELTCFTHNNLNLMQIHHFTKSVLEQKLIKKDIRVSLDKYRQAIATRYSWETYPDKQKNPLLLPNTICAMIITCAALELGYDYDSELEILSPIPDKQLNVV